MSGRGFRRGVARVVAAVQPLEPRTLLSGSAEFVVHVSVDGLRPDAVTQLGDSRLPNFFRLRREGAFTDNARTDFDYSITLPNHTTQVTGRYVVGAAGHEWVTNSDPLPGQTLHSNKGSYIASAWDVAHDSGLRTGLYSSKTKFSLYDESYDDDTASTADPLQSGAPDADPAGGDNGRDKIDVTVINTDSVAMTTAFVSDMASNPLHYALVHFHDTDTAGHATGWMQPDYFAALEQIDAQLGRTLSLLDSSVTLSGKTSIILTADHGGEGGGHGDASDPEAYTVPFYVWGPGTTPSGDLYRMNSDSRRDPGGGRPDNSAVPQPIRDGDAGNLAMDLLGLSSVPGSFFNAAQDLKSDVPSPPPPPPPSGITFQQRVNGYGGTADTQIQQANPSIAYGSGTFMKVDGDEPAGTANHSQGLLRFDEIFGNGPGQVPAGSEIAGARLELTISNAGNAVNLHRMLRPWSPSDTWNSLGAGVQANDGEAVGGRDATFTSGTVTGAHLIDVTASLRAWAADPVSNFGWALLPSGTDGVEMYTSEGAAAPKLLVDYYPPANLPAVTVTADPSAVAAEPSGAGRFIVTRGGDLGTDLTVRYVVSGTATPDADYASPGGAIVIAAGEASAVVDVAVLDDAVYDGGETVQLTLVATESYRVGEPRAASVSIADDEAPPPVVTVVAADPSAAEAGRDPGVFRVSRTGDLGSDLVVSYAVAGTAVPGTDYDSLAGSVTIPAGEADATFSVFPIDDTGYEPNESVAVTLSPNPAYDLGAASAATVTIVSDDAQPIPPSAPSFLAGKAINGGRIDLSWTDNSANETAFVIEWSRDGKAWSSLATVGANVTTYVHTGLPRGTTFYYRVRAINSYGASAWSNVLKIRSAAK